MLWHLLRVPTGEGQGAREDRLSDCHRCRSESRLSGSPRTRRGSRPAANGSCLDAFLLSVLSGHPPIRPSALGLYPSLAPHPSSPLRLGPSPSAHPLAAPRDV